MLGLHYLHSSLTVRGHGKVETLQDWDGTELKLALTRHSVAGLTRRYCKKIGWWRMSFGGAGRLRVGVAVDPTLFMGWGWGWGMLNSNICDYCSIAVHRSVQLHWGTHMHLSILLLINQGCLFKSSLTCELVLSTAPVLNKQPLTSSAAAMVLRSLSDPIMIPICAGPPADSAAESDLPEVEASCRGSEPGCLSSDAGGKAPAPANMW